MTLKGETQRHKTRERNLGQEVWGSSAEGVKLQLASVTYVKIRGKSVQRRRTSLRKGPVAEGNRSVWKDQLGHMRLQEPPGLKDLKTPVRFLGLKSKENYK